MKRLIASLLTVASLTTALSMALAQRASAMPQKGWVSTTIEGGVANLRSGPSINTATQVTAANGSPFSIVREQKDSAGYTWYQVRLAASVMPTSDVWLRSDLVSLVAPIAAQPQISCDNAIAQTESKIRSVFNTQIGTRTLDDHNYSGNVPSRPDSFRFVLTNEGANSVLASPVLMNQLAAQLIESCQTVGLVTFTTASDLTNNASYGYMPERMVRPFSCRTGSTSVAPDWGEKVCF